MIRFYYRRLAAALLTGAILGVACIIGASIRADTAISREYLFSFWYNRLLMGLLIGLAAGIPDMKLRIVRGAVLGLLVSFAFYSSTGFADLTGFLAGVIYGMIIEFCAALPEQANRADSGHRGH